jgi:hypothetical protein
MRAKPVELPDGGFAIARGMGASLPDARYAVRVGT